MIEKTSIKDIIPLIYEAAYDKAHWTDVTHKMSAFFQEAAVGLISESPQTKGVSLNTTALFDISLANVHFEEYSTPDKNPGINMLLKTPLHQSFDMDSFMDATIFDRDPATQAILHPQKINKGILTTFERSEQAFGFITIFHRRDQPEFEEEHIQALNMLSPHISRACQIQRSIFQNSQHRAIADWNNQAGHPLEGTMLLSRKGVVMSADFRAQAILENQNKLVLHYGKLTSRSRRTGEDNKSFQRFLSRPLLELRPFTLWTNDGALITLALVPMSFGGENIECQAINIRMTRPQTKPNIAAFASAYCLTKAESKVIFALTRTANATEAAKYLDLSRDTVKTHLGHIYEKTNCPSLPQLMLLIGRLG